ncbi:hypothetical protein CHLRE_02g096850v5 [Chlamydomonas reinhardtii]|uniref:Transmembrane protein 208 n=1 Tax=Chlamydomonas reinhardtii TaxID=3055 RepID=A0A2K3E232_CHLRE|nr:uncharacterized protein CHLRE_02g096850v5 [Chlamydomonas reinhardtii]PNW86817.1 hypothetical protein CHLRE_02g096850v5 [Chlamydomonas reinhardtii]
MAGAGAKKQFEANRKKLSALRIAIAVGIIAHALIRMVLRQGYLSKWHWIGFGATFMLEAFAYSAISRFAEPEYSESGELLYGGADLNMGGMCGYWHDLLYISVFTQVATCLSLYLWYTLLVVPGFALYMLAANVLLPYWRSTSGAGQEQVMDEATRKKMERTQQRAERRRMKWR